MARLLRSCMAIVMLAGLGSASAVTLDAVFSKFRECEFSGFYYAPWKNQSLHPYFLERKLTPHKEKDGLFYVKVKDTLFGLPVSELIVPGTWDFHAVIFDVPPRKARAVLKRYFGTAFFPSTQSMDGERPALGDIPDEPEKSILYCNEREGGL